MIDNKMRTYLKLDDRNHVEMLFLNQLAGLGWEVIELDDKQYPKNEVKR